MKKLKTASLPTIRVERDIRERLDKAALDRGTQLASLMREAILCWMRDESV